MKEQSTHPGDFKGEGDEEYLLIENIDYSRNVLTNLIMM